MKSKNANQRVHLITQNPSSSQSPKWVQIAEESVHAHPRVGLTQRSLCVGSYWSILGLYWPSWTNQGLDTSIGEHQDLWTGSQGHPRHHDDWLLGSLHLVRVWQMTNHFVEWRRSPVGVLRTYKTVSQIGGLGSEMIKGRRYWKMMHNLLTDLMLLSSPSRFVLDSDLPTQVHGFQEWVGWPVLWRL